jgi:outer membrane protein assembly factor BamE
LFRHIILVLAVTSLVACSSFRFPGVHRINVQQGNVVTQQMIDKLRPGMTRSQVRFVLGNPVIDDQLDASRWDYLYSFQIAGGRTIRKVLSLYFVEERLSYFEGDFLPTEDQQELSAAMNEAATQE